MDTHLLRRFLASRVARLATVSEDGRPHVVPITFAADAETIVFAIDHKPKATARVKRLENISANSAVSVLADHYDEVWDRLWWVRADGRAKVIESGHPDHTPALDRLVAKYPQYRTRRPEGAAVLITIDRWSGWRASAAGT